MKMILNLCLVAALVPGVMAGCSKEEQPVQGSLVQEQANVAMEQPLRDVAAQTSGQAQQAVDEAKLAAGEAMEAVQMKAAEVTTDMKEQLRDMQDMNALADELETAETKVQDTEAALADLKKEVPAAPAVASAGQEAKTAVASEVANTVDETTAAASMSTASAQ